MKKTLKLVNISGSQTLNLMSSDTEVWEWFQTHCDLYDFRKDYVIHWSIGIGWTIHEIAD